MTGFDITGTSAPWVLFVPPGAPETEGQPAALEAKGGHVHHFAAADLMTEQGIACVIHDADALVETEHFPLSVSVLCQGADRANSAVDLDGFPPDRPAVAEHVVFECGEFDREAQEKVAPGEWH
ncbi:MULTISPECIES: hypothetical protein [Streptomyces]|uniref:hypothetical protein n=1 Tax=Streptomyces TaxID=1883 RepID=UPI001681C39E|nr:MULTISPECIES: hypothetical protein [Streptomyces]